MKIKEDVKLDFNDVLIEPIISDSILTRKNVNIEINWLNVTATPVCISNMLSTGTYNIAKILTPMRVLTCIHKEYSVEEHLTNLTTMQDRRYIAITSGIQPWDLKNTTEVFSQYPDIGMINVDIANTYANIEGIINTITYYRNKFPHAIISAGNVATPEIINKLIRAGADYIKIGVGSGAACKTRTEIGVGVPQLSAIIECYDETTKHGGKIISDGGCVTAGDVCKAIAAGAEIVMIAGMVSKSIECDNIIEINGKKYVNFWGLGSDKQYKLTSPTEQEYRPNEGRDLLIPCEGSIVDILKQIQGSLRSLCTYVGVKNINEVHNKAQFIKVNNIANKSLEKYEQ